MESKTLSCWSCTVIIEQGAKTCPLCGADQTKPVEFVNPYLAHSQKPSFYDWGIPIVVILVAACLVSLIYLHNFGEPAIDPTAEAASVTANSLREIREALSVYALSAKDTYPVSLSSLGDRLTLPLEAARAAGYRLEYLPKPSNNEESPRGFALLARPEKDNYWSLYVDESGVVRGTQENRAATAMDPPI